MSFLYAILPLNPQHKAEKKIKKIKIRIELFIKYVITYAIDNFTNFY